MRSITATFVATLATTALFAQAPSGPTFDVVSIKRHIPEPGPMGLSSRMDQRPDGGFTMTNVLVGNIIARAYPGAMFADIVGLPGWTRTERFDLVATSPLEKATPAERAAMMLAMLADRFQFVAHIEQRPHDVYDLVLARSDRRLGAGLTPIDTDCAPQIAAQRAAFEVGAAPQAIPDLDAPPPPCTIRSVRGRYDPSDRLEGEATMESLSQMLRMAAGRIVVDKTELSGSYRVRMNYDLMGSRRPPATTPPPDAGPTVFDALREQLGLKLESSRTNRDTLVIDRLERPSEN